MSGRMQKDLIASIDAVINMLEERLILESKAKVIIELYDLFRLAREYVKSDDYYKIKLQNCCRIYLENYSDYNNPLLTEMDKSEKLLTLMVKQMQNTYDSSQATGVQQRSSHFIEEGDIWHAIR